MSRARTEMITRQLLDDRSRRVAFVSHCLLNENTRYLGGACRPAGISELVDELLDAGIGLYQMPCPEQHAWGGVLKRRMLIAYGRRGTLLYRLRAPLLWLFMLYTRIVYRRLASRIAADIADYERSGFTVVGIVGVSTSPSCGVTTVADIRRSFEAMASIPISELTRRRVNREVVLACQKAGQGLFVTSLQHQLRRRGLTVPWLEHDLVVELRGQRQHVPLMAPAAARATPVSTGPPQT